MTPYKFPHVSEGEGVHRLMDKLSGKQQRALRSFVRLVEFGEMSVEEWCGNAPDSVARSTWYKPDGGYYHDADFQAALAAYRKSYSAWVTAEEQRSVEQARRSIRLETAAAAQRMIDLSRSAEDERVRFQATKDLLSRADDSLAERNAPQRLVHELSDEELEQIVAGEMQ